MELGAQLEVIGQLHIAVGTRWRLGGSHIRSWSFVKERFLPLPGTEPRFFCCAWSLVTTVSATTAACRITDFLKCGPFSLVWYPFMLQSLQLSVLFWCINFWTRSRSCEKRPVSFVMSVRLYARLHGTTRAPAGRILVEFNVRVFFDNLSRKFKLH